MVAAAGVGEGRGSEELTDWECAGGPDVREGLLHVRHRDGFGTVPVDEPVLDGEPVDLC